MLRKCPTATDDAQVGDQLDRGDNEIQILYFLERLQKEATAAGGALHILNGNHETMNVGGRFRYATAPGRVDFIRWQLAQNLAAKMKVHAALWLLLCSAILLRVQRCCCDVAASCCCNLANAMDLCRQDSDKGTCCFMTAFPLNHSAWIQPCCSTTVCSLQPGYLDFSCSLSAVLSNHAGVVCITAWEYCCLSMGRSTLVHAVVSRQ